jgi:hypothetical protein
MTEYDSPWKEALDVYFEAFLGFCFPQVHRLIDWTRGYEPLDKELQKIAPTGETGRRVVDKLMRVWSSTGDEEWILVHVEVQSQPEASFPKRMFVYHYRLLDRYNRSVVSLAVLGDENADWRPDRYVHELCGCGVEFHFPIVKLLDYVDRTEALETSDNPFATVVLAHLKAQQTYGDNPTRFAWKLRLVRTLYDRGFNANQVRNLFRFIDWMMDLPRDMEERFSEYLHELEEEKHMPYVTSVERLAHEEGIEKGTVRGLLEGIETVLELRFGERAESIVAEIRQMSDPELLGRILHNAKTIDRPEELAALWNGESDKT